MPCNLVDRYQRFRETFIYRVKVQAKWTKWHMTWEEGLGPEVGLAVRMQAGLWVNQWQPASTKRVSSILKMEAEGCSITLTQSLKSSCIKSWKKVISVCNVLPKQTQFLNTCYIWEQKTLTLHHINIITILTWLHSEHNNFIIPESLIHREHWVACMLHITITIHSAYYLMWQHWLKTAWEVSEFIALLMHLDSFAIVLNFWKHSVWTFLHCMFNRFTCLSL